MHIVRVYFKFGGLYKAFTYPLGWIRQQDREEMCKCFPDCDILF